MTAETDLKVICLNCMAFTSDHCTARCPSIKCKLCKMYGHVKRDCPKIKHVNKDYSNGTHEQDEDLIVYWGGHCDVCKQGVRNLEKRKRIRGNWRRLIIVNEILAHFPFDTNDKLNEKYWINIIQKYHLLEKTRSWRHSKPTWGWRSRWSLARESCHTSHSSWRCSLHNSCPCSRQCVC